MLTHDVTPADINLACQKLITVPDKFEWKTTTSRMWKIGLMQYLTDKPKKRLLEIGGAQGHTTCVIAPLVSKLVSIDFRPENCEVIESLGLPNVEALNYDLYEPEFREAMETREFDLAIIDAVHTATCVKYDIESALKCGVKTFVFDDFGAFEEVRSAVKKWVVSLSKTETPFSIHYIGLPPGTQFGNTSFEALLDWEGIIVDLDVNTGE